MVYSVILFDTFFPSKPKKKQENNNRQKYLTFTVKGTSTLQNDIWNMTPSLDFKNKQTNKRVCTFEREIFAPAKRVKLYAFWIEYHENSVLIWKWLDYVAFWGSFWGSQDYLRWEIVGSPRNWHKMSFHLYVNTLLCQNGCQGYIYECL